jgi:glycosyltransferase involved in cell wall biosynthesis
MNNIEKKRVLIISHGHPKQSIGGGEKVAYSLFQEIQTHANWGPLFVAAYQDSQPIHLGVPFANYSTDGKEILYYSGEQNFFLFSKTDKKAIWNDFRQLLERFQPHIVHFHHYIHLSIELIREIRNYSQEVGIILTLHEYLPICYHNGQMVKHPSLALCYEAKPLDCSKCFPHISPADFKLRELYIKSFFKLVDLFISPSKFLIERYVDWGLPPEKMVYIENGQAAIQSAPARFLEEGGTRNQLAFFGQINPYKGLSVLLEALMLIPEHKEVDLVVHIHGGNLERQPEAFQTHFNQLLGESKVKRLIKFHGPYLAEDLPNLMAQVDWVIVPSIWWENSPLVIQEAFVHRRPVICSNIGGMAEKVQHRQTGLHFQVGSPRSLVTCLLEAARNNALWEQLHAAIAPPPTLAATCVQHLELYEKILGYLATRH